jgi:Ca2+-binding EF-hand superfamily protein
LKRPANAKSENIKLLNEKGDLSDIFEGALEDIYYRLDTMINNAIDYEEFKEFYETVGQTITEPEFKS